jgi:hypothetical protein
VWQRTTRRTKKKKRQEEAGGARRGESAAARARARASRGRGAGATRGRGARGARAGGRAPVQRGFGRDCCQWCAPAAPTAAPRPAPRYEKKPMRAQSQRGQTSSCKVTQTRAHTRARSAGCASGTSGREKKKKEGTSARWRPTALALLSPAAAALEHHPSAGTCARGVASLERRRGNLELALLDQRLDAQQHEADGEALCGLMLLLVLVVRVSGAELRRCQRAAAEKDRAKKNTPFSKELTSSVMAVMVRATPPMKPASPASCATSTGATRAATEAPRCCCTGCLRAAELWEFFWGGKFWEGAIEGEPPSSLSRGHKQERHWAPNRATSSATLMRNAAGRAGGRSTQRVKGVAAHTSGAEIKEKR